MAKSTEFEEDIEMLQEDTRITAREIRRPAGIREKSIQINLQKSKKYRKSPETPHTDDTKMFKARSKGKKEKGDEERREKWIDKRKNYKER